MYRKLAGIVGIENLRLNEPMSAHTTFRAGGTADCYLTPDASSLPEVLETLKDEGAPYTVIGNGSNLLVSDAGIEGVVIEIGKGFRGIRQLSGSAADVDDSDTAVLRTGAGELLTHTASFACEQGLTGFEFAGGIPGTVGGGVFMNAGAYDGEMKQVLKQVSVLIPDENSAFIRRELPAEKLDLSYRHSAVEEMNAIILSADIFLNRGNKNEIKERMEDFQRRRIEKQPLEYPSAGSTFKRPKGYFAGKLISDAGLRGLEVGGAAVSEKHCGFIINKGGASASDIKELMDRVSEKVYSEFNVRLEPEVRLLGRW